MSLQIENTAKTPDIDFRSKEGVLSITGISVPEDSLDFYAPIINWLKFYCENPKETTTFNFQLTYVNTSSLPLLYDMLLLLDSVHRKKTDVTVNWYHIKGDDDLKEVGEDLQDALSINFSFIEVDPDRI